MTFDSQPRRSLLPVFGFSACALLCVGLLLVSLLPGCGRGKSDPENGELDPKPVESEIPVESILQNLRPDAYGITVPPSLPRGDLDEWGQSMLADMIDQDVDETTLAAQLGEYLQPEQVERILRRQFTLPDCTHIRDMLWARDMLQKVPVPWEGDNDLNQITAVFYHVVHSLPLAGDDDATLPLGPFESMLYGRGTAADRAWVFSVLMQQRRIPVVVLALPDAADNQLNSLLVGVLVGNELNLFDVALGLPVPDPDESAGDAIIHRPATLKQAIADDGLLRQLDADDRAWPVTAELLQQARVQIIGDTSLWSRRMEGLNNALTGSSIVYMPLTGDAGMIERLSTALEGQIPADRIGVWDYADQQRSARESLSDDQQSQLEAWNIPLEVPYLISVADESPNEPPKVIVDDVGRQTLRVARVDQILGQSPKAIPRFLKVQGWRQVPPTTRNHAPLELNPTTIAFINSKLPDKVREAHQLAAEQARFWRATCQLQQGNWSAAARDLESYIVEANRGATVSGVYRDQAAYLCGIALAFDGRLSRASAYMRLVPAEAPSADTARLLEKRWTALAAAE